MTAMITATTARAENGFRPEIVTVERERPVYVAPPVVYPMVPQGPSGLNLNFNIPLN